LANNFLAGLKEGVGRFWGGFNPFKIGILLFKGSYFGTARVLILPRLT